MWIFRDLHDLILSISLPISFSSHNLCLAGFFSIFLAKGFFVESFLPVFSDVWLFAYLSFCVYLTHIWTYYKHFILYYFANGNGACVATWHGCMAETWSTGIMKGERLVLRVRQGVDCWKAAQWYAPSWCGHHWSCQRNDSWFDWLIFLISSSTVAFYLGSGIWEYTDTVQTSRFPTHPIDESNKM